MPVKKSPPTANRQPPTTIMGIDPGYGITGYGVLKETGQETEMIDCGCIVTSARMDFSKRLEFLHGDLKRLIRKYRPQTIAIEKLFFSNNAKTAIKVGEARGIILLTAIQEKVPIVEYTPLQVKQAIVGYGKASKQQVQKMVQMVLGLPEIPRPDDAADALAIAICGCQTKEYR